LAEAVKQGTAEPIRARTEILDNLLAETKKAEDAPRPAIQISSARSSAVAAAQNEPLQSTAPLQKRVALVIGNSDYKNANSLANPRNDAKLMSAALADLGFEVIEGEDLDKLAMERKVRDFVVKQSDADVSLFYYAGPGFERCHGGPWQGQMASASHEIFKSPDSGFEP